MPTIPDQRLALVFACAHPAIAANIRAPLTLQVVIELDAERIASAFLMSPAAMGKRLVRAKEKIRQAGISFRVPERGELGERLDTVLGEWRVRTTGGAGFRLSPHLPSSAAHAVPLREIAAYSSRYRALT